MRLCKACAEAGSSHAVRFVMRLPDIADRLRIRLLIFAVFHYYCPAIADTRRQILPCPNAATPAPCLTRLLLSTSDTMTSPHHDPAPEPALRFALSAFVAR